MDGYDKVKKGFLDSLKLLDVPVIRFLVLGALILYNTLLIPDYNKEVSKWFSWFWFKLFFLLITIWIACKDKTISLLMGIAFVLSVLKINNAKSKEITNFKMDIKPGNNVSFKLKKKNIEKFDENIIDENIINENKEQYENNIPVQNMNNSLRQLKKTNNQPEMLNQFDGMNEDAKMANTGINGYNECYSNCSKGIMNNSDNLSDPCSSVQAWSKEMSPQGLNCKTPGWAGNEIGADFNQVIN